MDSVLYNQSEGRLRALWRILVIQILFWGAFLGLETLTIHVTDPWLEAHGALGVFVRYRYLHVLRALLTLLCLLGAALFVDRRSFRDYGFHGSHDRWRQLSAGFAFGLLAVSIGHLLALATGSARVAEVAHAPAGIPFALDFVSGLLAMFLLGFTEEGMTRAHPMKNLAEGLDGWVGTVTPSWLAPAVILPPSFGFAFAHSLNGGNYWIKALFFLWCFGVIFGCIYYVTGSLAFPIGLHTAWDFGNTFLFRSAPAKDCYFVRLEPKNGGRGFWIPNDNVLLILLMGIVLFWFLDRTMRPGFRSPLFAKRGRAHYT